MSANMGIHEGNPLAPAKRPSPFDAVVRIFPSVSADHVCLVAFEYVDPEGRVQNPVIKMELPRSMMSGHLEEFLLGLVGHRSIFSPGPVLSIK
jgi:hypothetical protein